MTPLLTSLLVLLTSLLVLVLETGTLLTFLLLSLYRGEQCMTDTPAPLITATQPTEY